ncbi:MAG: sulfite exporter TauE/SafE family protein [Azospirillum sp.]|nr:sulfite exporter TauE/SafE family protein [Azospirillum sp.]MCA3268618.1 sulfite exporter TauE/SafE family protein [Azospirillum sp.]MCZ8123691.1 sulfite exporter TauE/SafE family protein [Magnetospirillum sp.]
MQIYLPIAEVSVDIFLLLLLGGGVGFLSGLFGVGGGFLMTPLLIFIGIAPAVAVGSEAAQIVAASVSGVIAHMRRGNVDFRMGGVLLAGGIVGSTLGVQIFAWLRTLGQVDFVISIAYVVVLGLIGALMLVESANTLRKGVKRARAGAAAPKELHKLHEHTWLHGLPLKMRFPRSKLYISAIAPFLIGVFVGVLSALMGVGGGFIMVPAMIYLLGMPTSVVIGTSLFQIVFVTANVTFLQAWQVQTVDIVLAVLLLLGGVVGAQFGARAGAKLKGEQLRGLLALIVLAVAIKLFVDLIVRPEDLYSIAVRAGGGH